MPLISGATQAEINLMLDEFEKVYAPRLFFDYLGQGFKLRAKPIKMLFAYAMGLGEARVMVLIREHLESLSGREREVIRKSSSRKAE